LSYLVAGVSDLVDDQHMKPMVACAAVAALAVLASCGGSSSPTTTATALLSQAGVESGATAYTVPPEATGAPLTQCPAGAAEADAVTNFALTEVSACVFSSSTARRNFTRPGSYPAGSALIQVGQVNLIIVTEDMGELPPTELVQSIASKTGGTIISY
jgi:hypothetical protein